MAPADKPTKAGSKKVDAEALKSDVQAFAAQLGLAVGAGGGDDAFSDFAPSKAKQSIAGSKPNKRQRLNDDADVKAASPAGRAAKAEAGRPQQQPAAGQQKPGKARNHDGDKRQNQQQPGGHQRGAAGQNGKPAARGSAEDADGGQAAQADAKKRDWNFGIGMRPGNAVSVHACRAA